MEATPESGPPRLVLDDIKSEGRQAMNVRVPRSVHEALKREAKREGVSLNQLCVAKLGLGLCHALGL